MIFLVLALIIISGIVGVIAFLLDAKDKPVLAEGELRAEDFTIIEN